MGFKLGTAKKPYAVNGEIKGKLSFDKEAGDSDISVPGTPVIRKTLANGVLGEANMDGTIYVNKELAPGSQQERQVINHEMKHATEIKLGKLYYDDDKIIYNGETFERKTINGNDMIKFEGQWTEAGSSDFPWEKTANKGNGYGNI